MSLKRIILEMGTGNDLYGEDYTKAASLNIDRESMQITVTVGVQQPDAVDVARVAAQIPFGTVQVAVELGGLNVVDPDHDTVTVIAAAAVAARLDLPDERFKLNPA